MNFHLKRKNGDQQQVDNVGVMFQSNVESKNNHKNLLEISSVF
jgi:hypothetical protein